MEIGNIKIDLPKVFTKGNNDNKPLANLKEPIKDSFVRHNDSETNSAANEFESIKRSDGSGFDFVDKCVFKDLYKKGAIDVDVVKTFKDTKFNLYAMSDIYQMKNVRQDEKFYDKVFQAMDKVPNGKEATDFTQSYYEPTKEFSLNFPHEFLLLFPLIKLYMFPCLQAEFLIDELFLLLIASSHLFLFQPVPCLLY